MRKYLLLYLITFTSYSSYAENIKIANQNASTTSLWQRFKKNVSDTWYHAPNWDLYIPLNTWHNRMTYSREKIDSYNERPWGIGIGKSRFDTEDDWHALYAMKFQDSHNKWEPFLGYAYQKVWYPDEKRNWRLAIGFTTAITARNEYNYIPIPIALPLFGLEYKKLAIQNAYVPGGKNDGNVLFTWARWQL